jgi:hypothetical protein
VQQLYLTAAESFRQQLQKLLARSSSLAGNRRRGKGDSMKNQHHRPPPREYDVFCGKGRERSETLGNKPFKAVVDSYMERYHQAGNRRSLKTLVVEAVVIFDMRSTGARFFRKGPDSWVEISKERIIRDKIC